MMRVAVSMTALCAALVSALPTPARAQQNTHWRYNSVCYEVFVRSFFDSDGDGVGDFRGLIQKLDHINDGNPATQTDLGATCIWLMPISPSPSYHGYDITNYYEINRDYGTKEDFKQFMAEAKKRGIHVLYDLVLNHSSNEHPYFKSALQNPNSPYRDWYRFSPTVLPSPGWQAPVWHRVPGRNEFYYGLFWSGMPDLNLANPQVRAEAEKVARFWLTEMGVDGFRFDAVAHFFEGPNGEWKDVAAVHPWLRDYQAALRSIKPDVFTVGEVYDNLNSVLTYYPDQLDAFFAFEVADGIIDAVRTGSGAKLVAAVERVQSAVPDGRAAMFLRNHDQTRTLTDLNGDVARNKLATAIMLTLPGLPFMYYGEEIGMTGSKQQGDPRLRTPMQWSRAPAAGFTTGTPWEPLPADSFSANVEAQHGDSASLLNHTRRLIQLRTATPALNAAAPFVAVTTNSPSVLAYVRKGGDSNVLVIANLSGTPVSSVAVSTAARTFTPGRYAIKPLFGGKAGTLSVGGSGMVKGWRAVQNLGAFDVQILELSR